MPGNCPQLRKDPETGDWHVRLDEGALSAFVRWLCLTYAVPEEAATSLKSRPMVVSPEK